MSEAFEAVHLAEHVGVLEVCGEIPRASNTHYSMIYAGKICFRTSNSWCGQIRTVAGVKFVGPPPSLPIRAARELSKRFFIGIAGAVDVSARQGEFSLQTERLLEAFNRLRRVYQKGHSLA